MFLPEEDRYSYTRRRLNSSICGLFGGRIAEEMIFGAESVTTGAQNDIQRVTEIARNMVTKWGLSDKLGPLAYGEDEGEVFLGHQVTQSKTISDETAHAIDEEVRRIVEENYKEATGVLEENKDALHAMADALMKFETIDRDQIEDIMAGRDPRPPKEADRVSEPVSSSGVEPEEAPDGGSSEEPDEDVGKPSGKPASEH